MVYSYVVEGPKYNDEIGLRSLFLICLVDIFERGGGVREVLSGYHYLYMSIKLWPGYFVHQL